MSLAAILFIAVIAPASFAQSRSTGLTAAMKTAADAKPFANDISAFLKTQVAALADEKNPAAQQRARDLIVRESSSVGATPTPSFLEIYAGALNDQLMSLTAPTVPVRVRLNAAITLARTAKNTNNGKLAPAATKFVQDPCVAVSLWGVKAAQFILPAAAVNGKRDPLAGAIVDTAKKQAQNGDLIEEVYKALTLDPKLVNEQTAAALAPDLLRLFQLRVESYATTTPPRVDLERRGINALTFSRLGETKAGAALRPAAMQQLSNLITLLAQHAAARPEGERGEFIATLKNAGDALSAISQRMGNDANMSAEGKALNVLGTQTPVQEILDRATRAEVAIRAMFPELKPAPKMSDTAVRPELTVEEEAESPDDAAKPTSAPTTAPKGGAEPPAEPPAEKPAAKPDSKPAPTPKPTPTPKPATPAKPAGPAPKLNQ
jgi:hypothetical protein